MYRILERIELLKERLSSCVEGYDRILNENREGNTNINNFKENKKVQNDEEEGGLYKQNKHPEESTFYHNMINKKENSSSENNLKNNA